MGDARYPIVTTSDGKLRGKKAFTKAGTPYYTFKGIPFARPPLGELRFVAPQPVEEWDGVRDATFERSVSCQPVLALGSSFIPKSLQHIWMMIRGIPSFYRIARTLLDQSEDCLHLNVFTPELPTEDAQSGGFPVLFWIHGGAFLAASGREVFGSMDNMVDRGVVVVTINYRLGPFGFLNLDTDGAPGNAGLKDQVQALRWVQRNIAAFGGDSGRVTVYGISAGAVCAHLLTVSPRAKGLFHRVIAGSGSGLCDWAVTRDHVKHAQELAMHLSIEYETPEELTSALKAMPSRDILKALNKCAVSKGEKTVACCFAFVPSIERPGPEAFLSELPETIIREGRHTSVPIISGVTLNEGTLWYQLPQRWPLRYLNGHREMVMPRDLYEALPEDKRKEVANEIVQFYCQDKGLIKDTEQAFIQLHGDLLFIIKFVLTCHLHASHGSAPVYMYQFTFDGKLGMSQIFGKTYGTKVPGHADEMGYIAPVRLFPVPRLRPEDPESLVRQRLAGVITNFIKTGEPTFPNDTNLDLKWLPINTESKPYLEMGHEFTMRDDAFGTRIQFWNSLFVKYLNKSIL